MRRFGNSATTIPSHIQQTNTRHFQTISSYQFINKIGLVSKPLNYHQNRYFSQQNWGFNIDTTSIDPQGNGKQINYESFSVDENVDDMQHEMGQFLSNIFEVPRVEDPSFKPPPLKEGIILTHKNKRWKKAFKQFAKERGMQQNTQFIWYCMEYQDKIDKYLQKYALKNAAKFGNKAIEIIYDKFIKNSNKENEEKTDEYDGINISSNLRDKFDIICPSKGFVIYPPELQRVFFDDACRSIMYSSVMQDMFNDFYDSPYYKQLTKNETKLRNDLEEAKGYKEKADTLFETDIQTANLENETTEYVKDMLKEHQNFLYHGFLVYLLKK